MSGTAQGELGRRSLAMFVVFLAAGACFGILAGALPAVTHAAGIDKTTQGLGLTISTLATIVTMTVGGRLAAWAGNRTLLLIGMPAALAAYAVLLNSTSVAQFFIGFAVTGAALGLIDVIMNGEVGDIERRIGRPIFMRYHGVVSLSVAVFAILGSAVTVTYGPWPTLAIMALMLAAGMVAVLLATPRRPESFVPRMAPVAATPQRVAERPRASPWLKLAVLGVVGGLIMSAEMAAVLWSGRLLDELAPSLAALAGLAVSFYGLCNALVRLFGDRLRSRFGDRPLMMGSLALAVLGFLGIGLVGTSSFAATVVLFALIGFATACLVPCLFAIATREMDVNPAGAIGFVSLCSGVPRILSPWAFGIFADAAGLSAAFGMCALVLVLAIALLALVKPAAAAP